MKYLPAQLATFMQEGPVRRNLRVLGRFALLLAILVTVYTVVFHILMLREGQDHSWISGLYWSLTVMTTLGFGDITFHSDAGRLFSMVVLLSGIILLLIVLPFTFIQFFYAPWLEEHTRRRVPRDVDPEIRDHVLITADGLVTRALVSRLETHRRPYFLIEPELARATELKDEGLSVILGHADDALTLKRAGADRAAMIVAVGSDYENTNVSFTAREVTPDVPIVAFARDSESVDVLELAGSSMVLRLGEMLGGSLARRALGGGTRGQVVGRFGDLVIAEAPVSGAPFGGSPLSEGWLREKTGLTVVGIWKRGRFEMPRPEMVLEPEMVLVLAGSEEQFERFASATGVDEGPPAEAPVVILGGGRVGRAAADALRKQGVPYRVVEKDPSRAVDQAHYVIGNAADRALLDEAGIAEAATAIVTTGDDEINIYLTIYCRRLRPQMHIVSRANLERNVTTLHRAGADLVMSYASMGAGAVFNLIEGGDLVMIAEGLDLFRVPVPERLRGKALRDTGIREATEAYVVAVEEDGRTTVNPPPDFPLPAGSEAELILIGSPRAQRAFGERFD